MSKSTAIKLLEDAMRIVRDAPEDDPYSFTEDGGDYDYLGDQLGYEFAERITDHIYDEYQDALYTVEYIND